MNQHTVFELQRVFHQCNTQSSLRSRFFNNKIFFPLHCVWKTTRANYTCVCAKKSWVFVRSVTLTAFSSCCYFTTASIFLKARRGALVKNSCWEKSEALTRLLLLTNEERRERDEGTCISNSFWILTSFSRACCLALILNIEDQIMLTCKGEKNLE